MTPSTTSLSVAARRVRFSPHDFRKPQGARALLEAGAAHPCDAIADPAAWFTLAGTSVDWAFETARSPAPTTRYTRGRAAKSSADRARSTG